MLCVAALVSGAGRATSSPSTISIRVRPIVGICAGLCPDFKISLVGERRVVVRQFAFRPALGRVRTFDVPSAAAAAFREELAPLRPAGTLDRGVPCPLNGADERLRYGASDYDIRWSGGGAPSRLRGCKTDRELDLAVTRALLDLSLTPAGTPLTQRQVGEARACLRQKGNAYC